MTERELLENAAYACGKEIFICANGKFCDEKMGVKWNPIEDDEQCFRMIFEAQRQGAGNRFLFKVPNSAFCEDIKEFRLECVRMVAGIGKWMKENGL